ncbi:MAG: hypothetical protein JEZ00_11415 [Anaerolineaceae bacterium]|nr:hypothetical protein [Anaerolineaceae bacterium]
MISKSDKRKCVQNLSGQVISLQEDLSNLSDVVAQLAVLSEDELASLNIAELLEIIHVNVDKLNIRCQAVWIPLMENEFYEPYINESQDEFERPEYDHCEMRKDTKRANKLAKQLSLTLTKVHRGMGGFQTQPDMPAETLEVNQLLGKTFKDLITNW